MTPGILTRSCKLHHKSEVTFIKTLKKKKKKLSFQEYSVPLKNYSY